MGASEVFAQSAGSCNLKSGSFVLTEKDKISDYKTVNLLPYLNLNENLFSLKPDFRKRKASRFKLFLMGIPVHHGIINCQFEAEGKVNYTMPDVDFSSALSIAGNSSNKSGPNLSYTCLNGSWILVSSRKRYENEDITNSWIDYLDENGVVVFSEDWLLKSGPDSSVKATVFRPDPVTRLKMPYGGLLVDQNDNSNSLLNSALDTVYLKAKFDSDTFYLENQWFKLGEYSLPTRPLAKLTQSDFCFRRDNPYFEEVNVYYHLNRFRSFIDSLGFSDLADYQLQIDAHGMDGADQSAYSPVQNKLAYGDGNVDDGEDAGVIIHEYCHALAQSAIPFGNSGLERRSLEEGFCDYLAGSYCKSLSNWQWERLFKWDGNNEFWSGRSLVTSKMYPNDLVGQIHRDGEIFSSALMGIELLIGRRKTHQILLESMPFFLPNMTMRQAAKILLSTDSSTFGGVNNEFISQILLSKGLHPSQVIVSNGFTGKAIAGTKIRILQQEEMLKIKNTSNGSGSILLLDQNGRILKQVLNLRGNSETGISTGDLNAGVFLIKFSGSTHYEIQRIVILPR
jgi:hypothetical protein